MKLTLYRIISYDSEQNIYFADVKVSPVFLKGILPRVRSGAVFIPSECKKYLASADKVDLQDMLDWNTMRKAKNTPLIVLNEHSTFIPANDLEIIAAMIEKEAERRPVYVIEDKNRIFLYFTRAIFFAPSISLIGMTSVVQHEYLLNDCRIDYNALREFLLKKSHGITTIPEDLEINEIEKNVLSLPLKEFVLMCADEDTMEDLQFLASTYQIVELYDISQCCLLPGIVFTALSSFAHLILRVKEQFEFFPFEPERIDRVTKLNRSLCEENPESSDSGETE